MRCLGAKYYTTKRDKTQPKSIAKNSCLWETIPVR